MRARDLRRTLDDSERIVGFADDRIGPFGGAVDEFTGCHALAGKDEDELVLPSLAGCEVQQPIINSLRGVGHNDPCPFSSGNKYKKCCLA